MPTKEMANRASGQRWEAIFRNPEVLNLTVRNDKWEQSEEILGKVDMGESLLEKVNEMRSVSVYAWVFK